MRQMLILCGVVASVALTPLASLAQVQGPQASPDISPEASPDSPAAPEQPDIPAPTTPTPEAATAMPDSEDARAEHLNQLFNRLSDPDNGNWERTVAQIQAAWSRSGSPSMDLIASRADRAMEAKDYATALTHLNDLTRLAPDFAEGWNKRATLYFIQGDYGASLDDIARTLKLEPRHFSALSGLGIILDRVGDPKGALEAYRRAVAIHPNLPGVEDGIRKLTKEVEGQRL